ncbi:MAG: hypothetical protein KJP20_07110 [Bacteroidia bacterium]|nr:hypothetical protein [Bacteroidia bacterium]
MTRVLLWFLVIIFLGFSPLIAGLIGGSLTELSTGQPCHEGNCFWGALPWYMFFTLPVSLLFLLIFGIIILVDSIKLYSK